MAKPIYLLGSGGHASVLVDVIKARGENISAVFSPQADKSREVFTDITMFNDENILFDNNKEELLLVNGIGSLPGNDSREKLFCKFVERGYLFKQVISQYAIISPFATLGHGVQVMHGAIVQAGAVIGDNTIINTGAIIEHDCIIGKHNHIAPGVTISGQVITSDNVHIGTGAVVIQGLSIGDNAIIAAGAIITKCIENEKIVFGARANVQDKKVNL